MILDDLRADVALRRRCGGRWLLTLSPPREKTQGRSAECSGHLQSWSTTQPATTFGPTLRSSAARARSQALKARVQRSASNAPVIRVSRPASRCWRASACLPESTGDPGREAEMPALSGVPRGDRARGSRCHPSRRGRVPRRAAVRDPRRGQPAAVAGAQPHALLPVQAPRLQCAADAATGLGRRGSRFGFGEAVIADKGVGHLRRCQLAEPQWTTTRSHRREECIR